MGDRVQRVGVSRSGDATAPGGVAITGIVLGDVNLATGAPVRTRYREQVRRIAPPALVGRDAELAELEQFCVSASSAGRYSRWRAPAWSGKTALMSWFVLHPPERVRIVSFFVTARLASQNDRSAFIENVRGQLLEILDQPLPSWLTDSTREAHLLGLLTDAAEKCHERGEHFVLLIDGLDEDRSVDSGPDAHSIAGLLPEELPAGMRVIVSGRPNPAVPSDVRLSHQLHDPAIIRPLAASPKAQAIRSDMERELNHLVFGSQAEQDLLGLVAAAGGGLSTADLAELTGSSSWQVQHLLNTVAGRSFANRASNFDPAVGPDIYILGHEELQTTALQMIGSARAVQYRRRLHDWADGYRAQGWPTSTPEYLVSGYFAMLAATGDVPNMVTYATDPARHNRMLEWSGGDSRALVEIFKTIDILAAEDNPDLNAMIRLAVHRDHLTYRGTDISDTLPALWARLGRTTRAEALASSIANPEQRSRALKYVAQAVADGGNLNRAIEITQSITFPSWEQLTALASVAQIAAEGGDVDGVIAIAAAMSDGGYQARMLRSAAEAVATTGDVDRALAIADSIAGTCDQTRALVAVARAAAADGDIAGFRDLITRAESVASAITMPGPQGSALAAVAEAVAAGGDVDRALAIANSIYSFRERVLAAVAQVVAAAGDIDRAVEIAEPICRVGFAHGTELRMVAKAVAAAGAVDRAVEIAEAASLGFGERNQVLEAVAQAAADVDDIDGAIETVDRIESYAQPRALRCVVEAAARVGDLGRALEVARSITNYERSPALVAVAKATATRGDVDRAVEIASSITVPIWRARALAAVAAAGAAAGNVDRTLAIADAISDRGQQARALEWVAGVIADEGDVDGAIELAVRAEAVAHSITDLDHHARCLVAVAQASASAGNIDTVAELTNRVEAIAGSLTSIAGSTGALTSVANAMAVAGDIVRALAIAESLANPDDQARALASIAEALAARGDVDRAVAVAESVTDPRSRARALASIVRAVATRGDIGRALTITGSITAPFEQVGALRGVANAAAASGDFECAIRVAGSITNLSDRTRALISVACAAADAGNLEVAVLLSDRVPYNYPYQEVHTLAVVAKAAAVAGDVDTAADLTARAEAIARSMTAPEVRALVFEAEGVTGRAESSLTREGIEAILRRASARAQTDPAAFVLIARASAAAGDIEMAADLIDRAEAIARSVTDPEEQVSALQSVATELAAGETIDRAIAIVRSIADPKKRGEAQTSVVNAVADAVTSGGDVARAEATARALANTADQLKIWTAIATRFDTPRREYAVAQILRLISWPAIMDASIQMPTDFLTQVVTELDLVSKLGLSLVAKAE